MPEVDGEVSLIKRQRQLVHEVEQGIREANREIIHARIPELGREQFVRLALVVARLRASYLHAASRLVDADEDSQASSESIAALRHHREAYEEGCHAFEALQRAIERGYVDIGADSPPV